MRIHDRIIRVFEPPEKTKERLESMGLKGKKDPNWKPKPKAVKKNGASPRRGMGTEDPRLPASKVLKKTWHGKEIEVKITGAGFEYGGKAYPSLSSCAKAITGAKSISGYVFFGIDKPKTKKPAEAKKKAAKGTSKKAAPKKKSLKRK